MGLHRFEYEDTKDLPMVEIRRRANDIAKTTLEMHRYAGNWYMHLLSQSNTNNGRTFTFAIYAETRNHERAVEATKENRIILDRLKKESV